MIRAEPKNPSKQLERGTKPRATVLQSGASAWGQRWAETRRADLRGQGRAITGGWPGTMSEARAIVETSLASELARRRIAALTCDEVVWLTKITYAAARREWLSRAERDTPESRY